MKCILSVLITCIAITHASFGQEVFVDMPQSNGYLGVPMKLVVVYKNIKSDAMPDIPAIDGFTIQRSPGSETSSQTTYIDNRVTTTSTSKHTFLLTPTRLGTLTIPELTFIVDGKAFQSNAKTITVIKTPTSGALKVEVVGSSGDLYLGQHIDLTLNILIEQFTDPQLDLTINEQDMFRLLRNNSSFGMFSNALREGRAHVQSVELINDAGAIAPFYLYTVQSTTWPETTGTFEPPPMTFAIQYPIALVRTSGDGFFNRDSIQIAQSHLISASVEIPPISVLTPPLQNQPEWYTGAVGNFDFRVVAHPTNVKVGEPITLTMRVIDRTSGPINLDYLSAPALDRVPTLTNNFKVPSNALGGTVKSRTKTFTQTIRPRNAQVEEIPALPMSSFNPSTGVYDSVWTTPIALIVEPVATVSASDIVGGNTHSAPPTTQHLTDVDGGILANYTGSDLLHMQTTKVTPFVLAIVVFPPLACLAILLVILLKRASNTDLAKRRGAKKEAINTIRSLANCSDVANVPELAHALRTLQEDEAELSELTTLLKRCDAAQFGVQSDVTLASDANKLVEALP